MQLPRLRPFNRPARALLAWSNVLRRAGRDSTGAGGHQPPGCQFGATSMPWRTLIGPGFGGDCTSAPLVRGVCLGCRAKDFLSELRICTMNYDGANRSTQRVPLAATAMPPSGTLSRSFACEVTHSHLHFFLDSVALFGSLLRGGSKSCAAHSQADCGGAAPPLAIIDTFPRHSPSR